MILKGIADVEAGNDPMHTIRSEDENDMSHIVVMSEVVPVEEDHMTLWKKYAQPEKVG